MNKFIFLQWSSMQGVSEPPLPTKPDLIDGGAFIAKPMHANLTGPC